MIGMASDSLLPAIASSVPLVIACIILAGYRIARLIVHDEILGSHPTALKDANGDDYSLEGDRGTGLRRLVDLVLLDDDGDPRGPIRSWVTKLIRCPVCVGVWVDAALLATWETGNVAGRWVILGAAVAGGQAFLSTRFNA